MGVGIGRECRAFTIGGGAKGRGDVVYEYCGSEGAVVDLDGAVATQIRVRTAFGSRHRQGCWARGIERADSEDGPEQGAAGGGDQRRFLSTRRGACGGSARVANYRW